MKDLIPIETPQLPELFKPHGLDDIINAIATEARAVVPDIKTVHSRAAIASLAAKVARSKTYLDELGKEYVTQLKELPKQVDAERRRMRLALDNLRDEVRKPLTEWEEAQQRHQEELRAKLDAIEPQTDPTTTAEAEAEVIRVNAIMIDETWEMFEVEGKTRKDAYLYRLSKILERLETEARIKAAEAEAHRLLMEAEAEERAREKLEQERQAIARQAKELEEKAQRQALEAALEKRRAAEREKQLAEREEMAKRQAAEREKLLAEREELSKRQAEAIKKAREEQILENQRRLEQEREARATLEQVANDQAQVIADARLSMTPDTTPREALASHKDEAVADLMHAGIDRNTAWTVVTAIGYGVIRHLTLS